MLSSSNSLYYMVIIKLIRGFKRIMFMYFHGNISLYNILWIYGLEDSMYV